MPIYNFITSIYVAYIFTSFIYGLSKKKEQQKLITIIDYSIRWAVIVGSTVILRSIVTVPLAVHQNKLIAKIELSQSTLHMMTEALKQRVAGECRRLNMSAEEADREFRKQVCPCNENL